MFTNKTVWIYPSIKLTDMPSASNWSNNGPTEVGLVWSTESNISQWGDDENKADVTNICSLYPFYDEDWLITGDNLLRKTNNYVYLFLSCSWTKLWILLRFSCLLLMSMKKTGNVIKIF